MQAVTRRDEVGDDRFDDGHVLIIVFIVKDDTAVAAGHFAHKKFLQTEDRHYLASARQFPSQGWSGRSCFAASQIHFRYPRSPGSDALPGAESQSA